MTHEDPHGRFITQVQLSVEGATQHTPPSTSENQEFEHPTEVFEAAEESLAMQRRRARGTAEPEKPLRIGWEGFKSRTSTEPSRPVHKEADWAEYTCPTSPKNGQLLPVQQDALWTPRHTTTSIIVLTMLGAVPLSIIGAILYVYITFW